MSQRTDQRIAYVQLLDFVGIQPKKRDLECDQQQSCEEQGSLHLNYRSKKMNRSAISYIELKAEERFITQILTKSFCCFCVRFDEQSQFCKQEIILCIILLIGMSNLANYSPYNKTYKFILFQNQAYHERNKRNISPCVRTNLRHSMSRYSANRNPEDHFESVLYRSNNNSTPSTTSGVKSEMFRPQKEITNVVLDKEKKVIHRHQSYEKMRDRKINIENVEMVNRLISTQCQIIKKDHALNSFEKHKKYQRIRMRYNEVGQRKDSLPLGNKSLLCPTLHEFNSCGLGEKFIGSDLSMSKKPSTSQSCRRSYCSKSQLSP